MVCGSHSSNAQHQHQSIQRRRSKKKNHLVFGLVRLVHLSLPLTPLILNPSWLQHLFHIMAYQSELSRSGKCGEMALVGLFLRHGNGLASRVFFRWKVYVRLMSWLILLDLLSFCDSSVRPDFEGEALVELLRALNDSSKRINDWNVHFVSPCFSWSHVTCKNGNVISLSLASNGFSGSLSPSIAKLKFLVSLELENNQLSGVLPDFLGNMKNLEILNLADNSFTGFIPTTWGQLSKLKHLDLSSNNLIGSIPTQLFSISTFNFTGTHLDCGSILQQPCASSSSLPDSISKSKLGVVVGTAGGGALLLLFIGAMFIFLYRLAHGKNEVFVDVAGEEECKIFFGQLRKFSWRELQIASDNFSENNVIGQGGFGKVYKGVLFDNRQVAIKRLTDYHNPGGEAAFHREVELISVAVHRNLLQLIGICTTSSERILVYPFMQNLSVAYCLRDLKPGEKGLDWPTRKRVAFGTAHGLEYLHDHCNPKILHRDLKSANILLDDNFEPVLGDFGLAKLVDTKLTHITTQIKKLQREKRLHDIVDCNLKQNYDPKEVETIIQVALLCTQSSPEDRPKMAEVVSMMQGVGLAERWAEWEQLEVIRNQEYSDMSHQFIWDEESTLDQESIQLSDAR